jgi:hypothetical protein
LLRDGANPNLNASLRRSFDTTPQPATALRLPRPCPGGSGSHRRRRSA